MQLPKVSQNRHHQDPKVWDIVILGAGIAGSALAYRLGQDGRRVLVVERDLSQPDRIVGELLQPGGYIQLKNLGLADCVQEIDSQKVFGYTIINKKEQTKILYPLENLPKDISGRSFHHGRFVQKLRLAASTQPLVTMREGTGLSLLNGSGDRWEDGQAVNGLIYKTPQGETRKAYAHLTIVCDGMYSAFRNKIYNKPQKHLKSQPQAPIPSSKNPNCAESRVQKPSKFAGLILNDVELPTPNMGHVLLADPSPVLLYPISSREVRCLVDIPEDALPNTMPKMVKKHLIEKIAPQVPEQLYKEFVNAVETQNIKVIQNKQMPAKKFSCPGLAVIGDAYNMRHPLTGGGMTVALNDCNIVCDMIARQTCLSDLYSSQQFVQKFHMTRKPMALTVNTLAYALYKVFAADETPARKEMQSACFDYLKQGGNCATGPVSLLSGLNARPEVLVFHFFSVALFACNKIFGAQRSLSGFWQCLVLLYIAASIILPVLFAEGLLSFTLYRLFLAIYHPCKSATEMMMLTVYSVVMILTNTILGVFQINAPEESDSKHPELNKTKIHKYRQLKG